MTDTNDTPDDTLVHYGVKGMQWGKRKAPDSGSSSESSSKSGESSASSGGGQPSGSKGLSDRQKTALKIGGGALVAGALIATVILAKNGKLPVGNLKPQSEAAKAYAAKTKQLNAIAMKRNAEQAARQQVVRNMGAANRRAEADRRQNAATRLVDEVAIRNNAAQARRKITEANLAAEVAKRSEANRAASVARGEAIAARLGMSAEDYWKKQVSDFKKQNYQDTEDHR